MTSENAVPPRADLTDAAAAAAAAAQAAGITMTMLHDADQMHLAAEVLDAVWHTDGSMTVIEPNTLMALAHTGNYISAATVDDEIIGVCVAFFHRPDAKALHSHIAGVLPGRAGRGVGLAMKLHQRVWAAAAGVETITWTYDPLVARNAYFNLHRLGATAVEYLVDFYGPMTDSINAGQQTDRVLVHWPVVDRPAGEAGRAGHAVQAAPSGEARVVLAVGEDGAPSVAAPGASLPGSCLVQIPSDIESLWRSDPAAAASWRVALREVLQPLLSAGSSIKDFDRSGHYVLASNREH